MPTSGVMKPRQYHWSDETTTVFEKLKLATVTLSVLVVPDFSKGFVIETDASGSGLGTVLMQEQRLIAYFSQTLSLRAQVEFVYEKELMAIVLAIQRWRHYLLGRKFVVCTDQSSLKNLMEQTEILSQYQRWVTKLLGYDFTIEYKPGRFNKVATALSRQGPVAELYYNHIGCGKNTRKSRKG